jgi:TrmH family RNA methyltransferase
LGTIIRLADWFGIKNVVCSARSVELYNPKVVQSTMGSMFRVGVFHQDLPAFLGRAKTEASLPVFGAVLDGTNIYEMKLPSTGILVMGSESHGISEATAAQLSDRISIPSYGAAESLNVSTATAVLLAEFKRQVG